MNWRDISKEKPIKDGMVLIYAPSGDPKIPIINVAYWNMDGKP